MGIPPRRSPGGPTSNVGKIVLPYIINICLSEQHVCKGMWEKNQYICLRYLVDL